MSRPFEAADIQAPGRAPHAEAVVHQQLDPAGSSVAKQRGPPPRRRASRVVDPPRKGEGKVIDSRRVLPHTTIYDRVWGYDFGPTSNALRVYVGYLRRKLEDAGARPLIHTVRGVGYALREPHG